MVKLFPLSYNKDGKNKKGDRTNMLHTVIKKNSYQDSISLMLLTNQLSTLDGVEQVQVMMGTEANKDLFATAGLLTSEAQTAQPGDMIIVVQSEQAAIMDTVLPEIDAFLSDLQVKKKGTAYETVRDWEQVKDKLPQATVALISVPGIYAAEEIENALNNGLHAFVFSDNVPLEDEVRLKQKAHERGLLVMGPDCGTGIASGVPLAFANVVRPGSIGIVAASGTGIQEVSTLIDKLGGGVSHAIGTGGRDLKAEVGGITMKDAILGLADDEATDVIVVISKPPKKEVRDDIVGLLQQVGKPVVAIFLGEKPDAPAGSVYLAHTLEETAKVAVDLAAQQPLQTRYESPAVATSNPVQSGKTIKGLYSGGTLAYEAAMMISETLDLGGVISKEGYTLQANGFEIIDLGDDQYTQGRPHPMIDPSIRIDLIKEVATDESVAVVLFDIVHGYGSHENMTAALSPAIEIAQKTAQAAGRSLYFVATLCATKNDPQPYEDSLRQLTELGVVVCDSNAAAVRTALRLIGKDHQPIDKPLPQPVAQRTAPSAAPAVLQLLQTKPQVVNIGLESFGTVINEHGGQAIQFDWKPIAGGNQKLARLIRRLAANPQIQAANQQVIEDMKQAQPFLVDVIPAHEAIPLLKEKVILHAGPPITFDEMTGPMQGSCIGAVLFEEWAQTEEDALALLRSDQVRFVPCHHVQAVGPMGGITTGNMPVLVVENRLKGNRAYCTLNEGIGKVLRFGAYSPEVVARLQWMRDTLGPILQQALRRTKEGINLNVLIAKAITMGDEFHQRNIAASLNFMKEITPHIVQLPIDEADKQKVIQFLADTDQFFLNIMMATGKAIVDAARETTVGTIVTTMTRNGKDFGIRISGMGDQWFIAPVNTPQGLFFTGFTQDDANPDIGDSAITETVGVGGMVMIAAPGVTRFVGAGGFEDALAISDELARICDGQNTNWSIPTWDFRGAPVGIDATKVVALGITPLINTGIAHKKAGVGQVGAGTVRAPLACFEKALEAYAEQLGIDIDE